MGSEILVPYSRKMSRSWLRPLGTFDLVLWTVVLCVSVVAVVRALGHDDGWQLFFSGLLLLTSWVWLVRIFYARRERTREADHQPLP